MTSEQIEIWRCDFSVCTAATPAETPGWGRLVWLHGCPDHLEALTAHRPSLDSVRRGRGRKERVYWLVGCACGWKPPGMPVFGMVDTFRQLEADHYTHVRFASAPKAEQR